MQELAQASLDNAETMRGDLRDAILDRLKHATKPWEQMSEDEQRGLIDGVDMMARTLVLDMVRLVAKDGRITLTGTLEQVAVKDGMKATLSMSRLDENRLDLIDSVGKTVLVVVADAQPFLGAKDEARPDNLREPGLPLDDKPVFDNTTMAAAE